MRGLRAYEGFASQDFCQFKDLRKDQNKSTYMLTHEIAKLSDQSWLPRTEFPLIGFYEIGLSLS